MKEPRKKLGAIYSRSDERYDRQEHGNRQDAEQHVCLGQSPARLRCAGRRINRKGMVHERTPCNVTSSRRKATNVERRSVSSAAHAHLRGRRSSWATPTSLEDMHVPCQLAARHVKKRGWWRNVLEKSFFPCSFGKPMEAAAATARGALERIAPAPGLWRPGGGANRSTPWSAQPLASGRGNRLREARGSANARGASGRRGDRATRLLPPPNQRSTSARPALRLL